MNEAGEALAAAGLGLRRGQRVVLDGVGFTLARGQWLSVAGPNGAGKSTLLQCLAGLLPFTGEVRLLGKPLGQWRAAERARALAWLGQWQPLADHVRARGATGCAVHLLDQKLWNPNPDFFSYTLSKAALRSATTLLAQALAPAVRVVGVAPGLTLDSPWMADEADFQRLHAQSPLGRSSTPDDVAAAVLFALDNPAITGATLLVDGGQHLMRFERDFSMMAAGQTPAAAPPAPPPPASEQSGQRRIIISGLRFDASLGILRRERRATQPIVVDAELNMGLQPLRPAQDAYDILFLEVKI